ncbi:hypothetical protein Gohar_020258 [Gossypium harknessii]|uniref:Cytochrome P450 n=1 Tax=Gossypium harknessii TaxID=34285 RepID=A0A7J9HX49_9ROSI|nr:hypothetical protein [Gossypium harknessii]
MAVDMLVAILLIVLYLFLGHWYRNQNSGVKVWPIVGLLPALVSNAEGILYFFTDICLELNWTSKMCFTYDYIEEALLYRNVVPQMVWRLQKWFQLGEEKKLSKGLGIVDDLVAKELNKFVYIHAALCKTLRLYPPVPVNNKSSIEADVLPSRDRVGPRTRILLSVYSMGRSEEIGSVQ